MSHFGRRVPTSWEHVQRYPLRAVQPTTVATVERILRLPAWHREWDQGSTSSCVGHGCSLMMSVLNEAQARASSTLPYSHRYSPYWLWEEAKEVDEWTDTNRGDDEGTSVRAACDVLRTKGHVRLRYGVKQPVNPAEGIAANRWAHTVDEMRTAIANGVPVSIGVEWYSLMSSPEVFRDGEYWIGRDVNNLGFYQGGHCVLVYAASDRREAFRLHNSWGQEWANYGRAWITYKAMQFLLDRDGEATVVTDK